jgi:TFIIF-interacting CTD phosphatase-like protein
MDEILILDDNKFTCEYNSNNAITIVPWLGQSGDMELIRASVLFERLAEVKQVQQVEKLLSSISTIDMFNFWTSA